MSRNEFWAFWEKYGSYVVGPMLVLLGYLVSKFVEPSYPTRFISELTIALVIAGILTATVDPIIKRKARAEATRDIFHHMLGYSLPLVIRERLQKIVEETKFYRQNSTMYMSLVEEKDLLAFYVQQEFEIVNPTPHSLNFVPLIQFEKGEHAELGSVTCFEQLGYGMNAALTPLSLGSLEYRGLPLPIQSKGSRRFKYEYVVRYPTSLGFFYPNFQYPTIGLSLTIRAPEGINVRATTAEYQAQGEWRYGTRLFMPQEHLDIVWDKVEPSANDSQRRDNRAS
jgi:hypothetical protein